MTKLKLSLTEQVKIARARANNHLIDFSIATNKNYDPNWHHEEIARELEKIESGQFIKEGHKILMVFMPPRHGKQISNDVLVPTPKGLKRHGDLHKGNYVYSPDGKKIKVLWESEEINDDVRVWFSGGIFIDCHENHEWKVFDRAENKYRILETKEIERYKYFSNRSRFQVDYVKPIEGEDNLFIHPYLLGVWLGDGKSDSGTICFHKNDREHINRIKELGYKTGNEWGEDLRNTTILGLVGELKKIKVFKNKHIPIDYLTATEESRRELLRGLIDTDGSVGKDNRVRFININKRLIDDVVYLVESLGYRTCLSKQKASLSTSGIKGKSDVYTVSFSPYDNKSFGYIPRKNRKITAKRRLRGIVHIERREPKKGKCIEVEGGLYCVTEHFIPTHNSEECTINFPAWYLGRNPEKEIITASYSGDLAVKFGGKTRDLVNSPVYQSIFPNVKLKQGEEGKAEWMTNHKGTYVSVGVGGATTGKGANVFLIDDPIKNAEEAESDVYRDKVWEWFLSVAWTRLEPKGVMIIILTRWHLDDLAGRILNNDDFKKICKVISYPAIAELEEEHREIGEALWPNRYDLEELERNRVLLGSKNFQALYQQHPIASENQEFKPNWFRERTPEEVDRLSTRRFLTIDTAISQKTSADFTGLCDNSVDTSNFWNLKAWRLKIDPLELIDLLFTLHNNRRYEKIGIEKTIYLQAIKPFLDEEQRKRNSFLPIVELSHNQVNKEVRIRGLIPRYESGSIYHLKGECRDLEEELFSFPQAIHDDVSDATAYQLQIAQRPFEVFTKYPGLVRTIHKPNPGR